MHWSIPQLKKGLAMNAGIILSYHRVADISTDPFNLCVTPSNFADQLDLLRENYDILSLQQMAESVYEKKNLGRAIAITFDDGYADNLYSAKPLLEQYGVPATAFIATGTLGQKREFWWDELDRILPQPGTLPGNLCLQINGSFYKWDLEDAADYEINEYKRNLSWNWYTPEQADPGPRQHLYRSIYKLLNPLPIEERKRLMDEIVSWSGFAMTGRSTHRLLSLSEVHRLQEGELIEIGAHTVNHICLSEISEVSQRQEIEESKVCLEKLIENSVNSFAYPYGAYTWQTVDIVREIGFNCACTTLSNRIFSNADRFLLPRIYVANCNREVFKRWIRDIHSD